MKKQGESYQKKVVVPKVWEEIIIDDKNETVLVAENVSKYIRTIEQQLGLCAVMQALPKRLSNEAYKKAKTMRYEDFVSWWDKQV